ncbi:hemicentin-2-like [Schistocerca serialis cubense]|uniref:hemicentin-2-like n=1 Tax=Schistocerca serialis cubense TaxID=2023355 RepID=UPI00214ED238|nr:hemicentin-2-like [Schistocerca serialis cubense]
MRLGAPAQQAEVTEIDVELQGKSADGKHSAPKATSARYSGAGGSGSGSGQAPAGAPRDLPPGLRALPPPPPPLVGFVIGGRARLLHSRSAARLPLPDRSSSAGQTPDVTTAPTADDGSVEQPLPPPAGPAPAAPEEEEEEAEVSSEVSVRLHQEAVLECAPPPGTPHWRHRPSGGGPWRGIGGGGGGGDGGHRYATLEAGQLRISSVRLEDAGLWRCERRDARSHRPLPGRAAQHRLAVTEPPHAVFLEVDGRRLDPGNVFLPVLEGSALAVGCVAEGGEPPPRLSWRLALAGHTQPAAPLPAAAHVLRSEARLARLLRAHHNASVACLVQHPALPQPALQVSLLLDVQYSPSFAISRTPGFGFPLLEGMAVSLKCDVDSNPPSSPVWVKDDGAPPVAQSNDGFLNFSSISREHMGWYKCTSRDASSIGYYLNVIYVMMAVAMEHRSEQMTLLTGAVLKLMMAVAAAATDQQKAVGAGPQLSLERVLYQEAGVYRCEPDRRAQGLLDRRRAALSVRLNVTGAPVVHPSNATVSARSGQSVTLRFEFCANPAAQRALWLVSSAAAAAGSSPLCREAALTLAAASPSDAGEYSLVVRSPRGLAEGSVLLAVTRASGLAGSAAPPTKTLTEAKAAVAVPSLL